MTDDSLKNIYTFIKYLGLIDHIPNLNQTKRNITQFVALSNVCFEILDSNLPNETKVVKLRNLSVFNENQIKYIITNQAKIVKPFRYILQKRTNKETKINLQQGGQESQPIIDGETISLLTEDQRKKLIENLKSYDIIPILEEPIQSNTQSDSLLDKIKLFDFKTIIDKLKKFGLNVSTDSFRQMTIKLGIPLSKDELLNKISSYDKIGISKIIENSGIIKFDNLTGPPITLKDWIFFPLWSFENLPLAGPFIGIPIDFLSVMIAQIDMFVGIWVATIGNLRDPAVQAAASFFAAGTAGAGLVAAPAVVPVVNKIFDLLIHIVSHLGTILNMFVQISRKNFGLAYILFCEIVPIFETIMDTIINYMVIFNRMIQRNNKMMDILDVFLDKASTIILMLDPEQFEKQKQLLIEKASQPLALAQNITQSPMEMPEIPMETPQFQEQMLQPQEQMLQPQQILQSQEQILQPQEQILQPQQTTGGTRRSKRINRR
jgi:hypothetical protein